MNKKKKIKPIEPKQTLNDELATKSKKLSKKIEDGLSKPTASNGTPMDELKGASKATATLANIGGGSKKTGGGGMQDGVKTLADYQEVKARIDEKAKNAASLPDKSKKRKK